ncbi:MULTISPECIES: TetR/AcrR family transcriptional regulator [Nocardiopsis]|uniref:TetR family transcriptional regulator n=1 Tax=Nocardiopsis sinuspersici TaxID=501010 RepID=A0A1V3C6H2_9ACTN|nr:MULTISPECIES: TetR/AcrR family transcriptional regulator [Nocardiopsis]OOC56283.1 TetR family transcriptional regulator [Nocardiopsis sinuspersici]
MPTQYPRSGDPARSLALLWRTQEPVSRRSKPDLSVDRIVAVASETADTDGLAALSMRKVAERLGVGTMSLYTYVPGKGELVDLMLDAAYADLYEGGERPGHWRDRLGAVAYANWRLFLRHPWMLQTPRNRLLGPHLIAKYEYELSAVDGLGLTDAEMDSTVSLVNSYAEGAAGQAVAAGENERSSGMTDGQWWRTHGPLLAAFVRDDDYPLASRVGSAVGREHQTAYAPEHEFAFGLERVLDGVQVLVDSRSSRDAPRDRS